MMMMFQPRANRSRRVAAVAKGVAFVIALAGVFSFLPTTRFSPLGMTLVTPVATGKGFIVDSLFGILSLVQTKAALTSENLHLRRVIAEQEGQGALVAALKRELDDYKNDFGNETKESLVAASIVSRPPASVYDVLLIDSGAQENVAVGDLVIAPKGGLLGTIDAVAVSSARVSLFSHPGRITEAELSESRMTIDLIGYGGGMLLAKVPRDSSVRIDEVVVYPGDRSRVFGTVVALEESVSASQKILFIRPLVNVQSIGTVFVVSTLLSSL